MPRATLQWLSLVGVVWLQSINGTNSNFPAFSSQLKHLFSISQLQLNNLAFASDAGKLIGFLSGLAAAYLPLWLVLFIGSLLGLTGYGVQYLFITKQIACLTYLQVFLLTVLAGNSICWINTVCYLVAIRNFPLDRQVAVGLTTSYLGLSAKVYADIVDNAAFISSPIKKAKAYLFLNAVLPLLICVITTPFVREITVEASRNVRGGFIAMFIITVATGIFAVISSLIPMPSLVNLIGMGVFLLAPLAIPLGEQIKVGIQKWHSNKENKVYDEENAGSQRIESEEKEEVESVSHGVGDDNEGVKEEIGVKLMIKRVEFWLYFFVYLFGATLGLVFLNNLGQIAESRGCHATSSLVSLSSSFGFFGRLLPSLTDYCFSRSRYKISRPASIAASMGPMAAAFFLLVNETNVSLYISTAVIGVCTGAITSLSVSTTTELFGTKNFGVNHNVVVANIPIGSLIFGYLAAFFYHKEGNQDGKCMGTACYRNTFVIWGCLCSFGTLLALLLNDRTRKFYYKRQYT